MMFQKPSDRTLRRWLATGKPKRVLILLERDPRVAERLDELSKLDTDERSALDVLVTPAEDFEERVLVGVKQRQAAPDTAGLALDLLGLGLHVGRAFFEPAPKRRCSSEASSAETDSTD